MCISIKKVIDFRPRLTSDPKLINSIFLLFLPILILSSCNQASQEPPTPTPIGVEQSTLIPNQLEFYVSPGGSDSNPGTIDQPWETINHAAQVLQAGQIVYLREGTYLLTRQIRPKNSGVENSWIVYTVYPGELAILDASAIPVKAPSGVPPFDHDQGAFQVQNVSYIRVIGLAIKNAHNSGFTIRDSHHIELYNNITDTTFSPGIGVWDTDHDQKSTHNIKIMGNTITNANTWDMVIPGFDGSEPPHEAISIAGAQNFEVAYNYIYDSDKEGIDVKEVSAHGRVHHNYIKHVDRQGLYADSWFGVLEDIEFDHNVVRDCRGAGIVVSVEGGQLAQNIRIHHNLLYDNLGTGVFFSRWGDGPRKNIKVYNNTIVRNGCGLPNQGDKYYWITGGLYLFSTNLEDIDIRNNVLSENCGFQIGYSDLYLKIGSDINAIFQQKKFNIAYNLVYTKLKVTYPIYAGWPDNYANIYEYYGAYQVAKQPIYIDQLAGNFYPQEISPVLNSGDPRSEYQDPDGTRNDLGAFYLDDPQGLWWLKDFPPRFNLKDIK